MSLNFQELPTVRWPTHIHALKPREARLSGMDHTLIKQHKNDPVSLQKVTSSIYVLQKPFERTKSQPRARTPGGTALRRSPSFVTTSQPRGASALSGESR